MEEIGQTLLTLAQVYHTKFAKLFYYLINVVCCLNLKYKFLAVLVPPRAGLGQSLTQNLARGPLFLSGPTQTGPHFCRPVVARGNILLAQMARI